MPVVRNSRMHRETGRHVKDNHGSDGRPLSRTSITSSSVNSKGPRKKKASNAFFLYRSHVLANNLLPEGIKHQNDASRVAAQMWKVESEKTRLHFFALAEERKKEKQQAENTMQVPSTPPPLSPSSMSSPSSLRSSPPSTPCSACPQTPPAPKTRSLKLPISPSSSTPPSEELLPVIHIQNTLASGYDEPVLHGLAEEWYSPQRACLLSFTSTGCYPADAPREGYGQTYCPTLPFSPDDDVSSFPYLFG